jgi:outer membrane protein TolC
MLFAPFGERQHRAAPRACRFAVVFTAIVAIGTGCAASPAVAPRQAAQRTPVGPAGDSRPIQQRTLTVRARPSATSGAQMTDAERAIAVEATLPELLRIALAKNPEIAEARERLRAAREGDPAGSRLPDPEFEYQLWAQPLSKPYALDEAQMHMFGVRQAIPAPGTLGAREGAALARANVAVEARRTREQDVALRVRRAFAEYYRADREYRVHLDHVRVLEVANEMSCRPPSRWRACTTTWPASSATVARRGRS